MTKYSKSNSLPHWLIIIAVILWSSAFVAIRAGLKNFSPGSLALCRYLIASLTMLPLYLRYHRKTKNLTSSDFLKIFITGLIGIGVYNIALNYGEITISAGIASFIVNQVPVLIALLAVVVLKERLNAKGWIGFGISFGGIFLLGYGQYDHLQWQLGMVYVVIAAIASAFYSIWQKPLLEKINGIELTALLIWSGTILLLIFTPNLYHEIPTLTWQAVLIVLYLGIFPGVIAYTAWSTALAKIPASQAASYLYGIPLITTFMGWVLLNEHLTLLSLLGGIIAILGSIIVQWPQTSKIYNPEIEDNS